MHNIAAAFVCELQHLPHPGSWADLLISVQSVDEFSSESWNSVHPACPSLYCQSQPWIWSCSVAGSLLMFSVWYLGPIPISKRGPPGALTFWSAWRLSRPPACGISCQREQTTPLLQNIHPPPFVLPASLPFTVPPPSVKLPGAPVVLTGSGAASHSQLFWPWWWVRCLRCSVCLQEDCCYSQR